MYGIVTKGLRYVSMEAEGRSGEWTNEVPAKVSNRKLN